MQREIPMPVAVVIVVLVLLLVVGIYWYFSRPKGGTTENIPEMGGHPSVPQKNCPSTFPSVCPMKVNRRRLFTMQLREAEGWAEKLEVALAMA